MLEPNVILQKRYQITRLIGQGGMGAVYEALDQRLGTIVALKQTLVPGGQLSKAFEREARLLAGLRHPSLPKVIDHFGDETGQYLVMEFIPGEDLATMLERRGAPFSVKEVLTWAAQLLRVLEHLHTRQPPILHRDIKPQNLKLTAEGLLVLLDFGLAKGDPSLQSQVSVTGSVYGYTAHYAPLEQIHNSGTDARSDLYALGATLHHLLTGARPIDAITRATMVLRRQPDPMPSPTDLNPRVPPGVSAVLMQALSLNQDDRPASAAAMRQALAQAAEQADPALAPAPTRAERLPDLVLPPPRGAGRGIRAQLSERAARLPTPLPALLGRRWAPPVALAVLIVALLLVFGAGRGAIGTARPTQTAAVTPAARTSAPPITPQPGAATQVSAGATPGAADALPSASALDPAEAYAGSLPIAVEVRGERLDSVREFRFTAPGGATIVPEVQRSAATTALLVIAELPILQSGEQAFTLYLDGAAQPLAVVLRDYRALKEMRGIKDAYLYTGRVESDASGVFTQMLSSPDTASAPVAVLRAGDQVDMLRDDVAGWYQVRLWIESQSARRSVVGWVERWLVDDEDVPVVTPTPAVPAFAATLGPVKSDEAVRCGTQYKSSVFGSVNQADGAGIEGALVRVTSEDGRNRYTQRTGAGGVFNIGGLGCTTWTVELVELADAAPAKSTSISVKLNGGEYTSADVRFKRKP